MGKRLFDHTDLRVRNRAAAQEFYAQVLPAIGFRVDKSGEKWGLFEAEGGKAVEFFASRKKPIISRMRAASRFGRRVAQLSIRWPKSSARLAEKTWKARSFAWTTAPATTRSFSKTQMATSWKFATAKAPPTRGSGSVSNIECLLRQNEDTTP